MDDDLATKAYPVYPGGREGRVPREWARGGVADGGKAPGLCRLSQPAGLPGLETRSVD